MNILKRIYKKLRFVAALKKKATFQNFSQSTGTYFTSADQALFNLFTTESVEKKDVPEYFDNLSRALHKNLVSSGVSYYDLCRIVAGKIAYNKSGFTPDEVQQTLVDAYCKTNGILQEVMFDFLHRDHNQNLIKEGVSIFGKVDLPTIKNISEEISNNGYSVLPFKIPEDMIKEIMQRAKQLEYTFMDDSLKGKFPKGKIDDFNDFPYAKANASEEDLKKDDKIMSICTDPVLISILQTTLKAKVDLLHLYMWWSFKIKNPSDIAAQYFHYDLDSMRWLKIFIYLTDVDTNKGPHVAIPGTHKLGAKNYTLLGKRYNRITDEEMSKLQIGKVEEFEGKAGTIIIGDTRCWHKGKEVVEGNRLILQPTFAPTMFMKKQV
jgi:hypothetical protein